MIKQETRYQMMTRADMMRDEFEKYLTWKMVLRHGNAIRGVLKCTESENLIIVYRKSKIYQHLVGFQIFKMEERPNYPPINTQSKDTGRFYVSISHTFRLFNNSAMYVSKLKEEDPENAPFKSFFHTFQFSPFSDTMPKELVAFVDYLPTL